MYRYEVKDYHWNFQNNSNKQISLDKAEAGICRTNSNGQMTVKHRTTFLFGLSTFFDRCPEELKK